LTDPEILGGEIIGGMRADFAVPSRSAQEATSPSETPYDPGPQRERLRGWLAVWLTLLLFIVIILAFVSYWTLDPASDQPGHKQVKDILELLQVLFGPLATLVGTVIGFYFGGKRE
jgi:H+/Cl- antiporter ClcA